MLYPRPFSFPGEGLPLPNPKEYSIFGFVMIKRTRHAIYHINYYFVWCPKFGRQVLQGKVSERLIELLPKLVSSLGGEMLELEDRDVNAAKNILNLALPPPGRGGQASTWTDVRSSVA